MGSSYVAATIDIEGLQEFQYRSPLTNWLKDLQTEFCQVIYDRELYPSNLWLDSQPVNHETYAEEATQDRIDTMIEADIWVPPYWERKDTDDVNVERDGI